MVRDHLDEIYIAARTGEGSGADNAGGGGTSPTGGNAGYRGGGLRARAAEV